MVNAPIMHKIDCFPCDGYFLLIIYVRYRSYQQFPVFQYLKGTPESELRLLKISNRAADYHFLRQGKNTDVSVNETLLFHKNVKYEFDHFYGLL